MQFHLDQISAAFIAGWCKKDEQPARLSLKVNGSLVAETTSDRYRKDLQDAGLGSGKLAYVFLLMRPGLANGDAIEIIDKETGSILHSRVFSSTNSDSIEKAYDLIDEIPKFESPYWRPVLIDASDDRVSLQGELFVPEAVTEEVRFYSNGSPVKVQSKPARSESSDRYWFMEGSVQQASYITEISEERQIVHSATHSRPFTNMDLAFGVIPSRRDVEMFKFAGADRARRVAGGDDTFMRFASGGLTTATQLLRVIEASTNLPDSASVLDWGCGAARVLQFLAAERPNWRFHGADIDGVNISWCLENIPDEVAKFKKIPLMPKMDYQDSEFDLVYGLSVITHLEERTRNAWLAELGRVTKRGGLCVLSFMSPFHVLQNGINEWSLPIVEEISRRGIADHLPDHALGQELSSYYKAAYNTLQNLTSAVSESFDLVSFHPRSLLFQDAVVLRRR
jgi:ubiquinone/menaquinone biosynthesis C-methylase UbiE